MEAIISIILNRFDLCFFECLSRNIMSLERLLRKKKVMAKKLKRKSNLQRNVLVFREKYK